MCDHRFRVWGGYPGECGYVNPSERSRRGHYGDCGLVSPVAGLGKGSPWRLWTCDSSYSVWEGHTGNCRYVTLGMGSERVSPFRLWTCDTSYRVWEGSPWGHVYTCDLRYKIWEGVTLETGHVTPGDQSGVVGSP